MGVVPISHVRVGDSCVICNSTLLLIYFIVSVTGVACRPRYLCCMARNVTCVSRHVTLSRLCFHFQLWISENVINDFQDDFVVDIDPALTST